MWVGLNASGWTKTISLFEHDCVTFQWIIVVTSCAVQSSAWCTRQQGPILKVSGLVSAYILFLNLATGGVFVLGRCISLYQ